MSTIQTVRIGDRGRFVLPRQLRDEQGWAENDVLHLVNTEHGVVILSRDQMRAIIKTELDGPSLVDELLAQRSEAARREADG